MDIKEALALAEQFFYILHPNFCEDYMEQDDEFEFFKMCEDFFNQLNPLLVDE
jgi:hypothetical protein